MALQMVARGERVGPPTEESIVTEDLFEALLELQVTQQIIETRNGRTELSRSIFEGVMDKTDALDALWTMWKKRVGKTYRQWPESERQWGVRHLK